MRCAALMVVFVLIGGAPALAAQPEDANLIVPGVRIGTAKLGMTVAEINAFNAANDQRYSGGGCHVTAKYSKAGRAIWLQTTWAGVCYTAGGSGAGGQDFGIALREFGKPPQPPVKERDYYTVDEKTKKKRLAATAYWVYYPSGIAFRVVWIHSQQVAMVHAIAVFLPKKK